MRERESRRPVVYVGWEENVRSFGFGFGGCDAVKLTGRDERWAL